jgi:hypothetical protein
VYLYSWNTNSFSSLPALNPALVQAGPSALCLWGQFLYVGCQDPGSAPNFRVFDTVSRMWYIPPISATLMGGVYLLQLDPIIGRMFAGGFYPGKPFPLFYFDSNNPNVTYTLFNGPPSIRTLRSFANVSGTLYASGEPNPPSSMVTSRVYRLDPGSSSWNASFELFQSTNQYGIFAGAYASDGYLYTGGQFVSPFLKVARNLVSPPVSTVVTLSSSVGVVVLPIEIQITSVVVVNVGNNILVLDRPIVFNVGSSLQLQGTGCIKLNDVAATLIINSQSNQVVMPILTSFPCLTGRFSSVIVQDSASSSCQRYSGTPSYSSSSVSVLVSLDSSSCSSSLSAGAIAGIVIGVCVIAVGMTWLVIWLMVRRRRALDATTNSNLRQRDIELTKG